MIKSTYAISRTRLRICESLRAKGEIVFCDLCDWSFGTNNLKRRKRFRGLYSVVFTRNLFIGMALDAHDDVDEGKA